MERSMTTPLTHMREQLAELDRLRAQLRTMGDRAQREIDDVKRQISEIEDNLARMGRGNV
jgi:ribosomal protein L29